ncbi:hypothetical protein Hte_010553, partial [Hypoxylon texense]
MDELKSIAIVGGVSGLSLAITLRARRYDVIVFDQRRYDKTGYQPGIDEQVQAALVNYNKIDMDPATLLARSYGVLLSNTSIPVGDADDKNDGKDLTQSLCSQLHPLCPGHSNICNYTKGAEIKNMSTVVSGGDAYLTLQSKIIGSQ